MYPIPEVGWHVPQKIFLNSRFNNLKFWKNNLEDDLKRQDLITTSYEVYLERNKNIFNLFDEINSENIYKIYPHKIFCNMKDNRCRANDENNVYYYDHHHLSSYGSKLLSHQIIQEIKKISK